jgi:AraC-like DNA-binding protein
MADLLSSLLEDVRPRGALFNRSFLRPPWSLRFEHGAPLTLVTLLHGDGWVTPESEPSVPIADGDVAIVVGPAPYTISDRPDTAPEIVINRADVCTTLDGRNIEQVPDLCSASRDDMDGSSVLLVARYQAEGSICDRVLRGLPRLLVVPSDALPHPGVDMIVAELTRPRAGQQVILDRLLDLLLISALREWLDKPGSGSPAWYRAQADPIVGPALRLIHDDPVYPWTVGALAAKVAVSRATFARRFSELVGEPPLSYLTCWRLCLAADLLERTDATVDAIARQVGYANAYALSVAFKRVYGIRPTDHRRQRTGDTTPAIRA